MRTAGWCYFWHMSYDLILNNVSRHVNFNQEETTYFLSLLKTRKVPKKALVLEQEQDCRYISYVHSGALRAYHLDKEGRESTIMFAVADWWVTDMFCFLNSKPAMMYIEALEDSQILQLSKEHLEKLFTTVPKFEKVFRIMMQNAYTREQVRVIENLSLPAQDRYNSFLRKYPDIAKMVTQKQIASYLGITPEFLSAIRKNKKTSSS